MADITPIVSLNGEISPTASLTGELAMPEKVWMQGPPGPQGPKGDTGAAATVTVGTVTTGEPGTDAIVTNSGTENAAVLNFTIPKGETGAVGAVGTQGPKGDKGDPGPAGAGVPDGGTVGQLLSKTETGTAWIDPPQSGVQPDWNQNDSTALDYVKNRPFYTGNPVETVFVEERTVTFASGDGIYFSQVESAFEATAGDTYKVYWDGTLYERTCLSSDGNLYIGNQSIIGAGSDTGEPFIMMVFNGVRIDIGTTDTSASHTFSISGLATEIVKVDEKYLPTIPADKLPTIPAGKLPEIPADKLPTIPFIEFTTRISGSIANTTQPYFTVSNLSYSEIYSVVEKGNFQIKDSDGNNYRPINCKIDTSGTISITIMVVGSPMNCAILVCSANQTIFYRDGWWQIEATQK